MTTLTGGSLTASTLNVTDPVGWSLSTPPPLLRDAGLIGTLELWIATISTVIYGFLVGSHPHYRSILTPTFTPTGARSVIVLILSSAYFFKAIYVHCYLPKFKKQVKKEE